MQIYIALPKRHRGEPGNGQGGGPTEYYPPLMRAVESSSGSRSLITDPPFTEHVRHGAPYKVYRFNGVEAHVFFAEAPEFDYLGREVPNSSITDTVLLPIRPVRVVGVYDGMPILRRLTPEEHGSLLKWLERGILSEIGAKAVVGEEDVIAMLSK